MYAQFSNNYDRFVNWENRLAYEIPFIERQLQSLAPAFGQALKVLDAACGTGMHALALASKGLDVTGTDLSPEMIQKARLNSQNAGMNLRFEVAGFGSLSKTFSAGTFDAILCLGNSLPHLLTPSDLASALADFNACLRPGGLLLIQNRNFDSVMATKERWMEPQTHREGEQEWVFQRFYDFEPNDLIRFNIVTLTRKGMGKWKSTIISTRLKALLQKDLVDALNTTNFVSIQSYGSLSGEPFIPLTSANLVLSAQKHRQGICVVKPILHFLRFRP
jgi:glycine/sarcosine N-methyltransferase